uniref:Uncharacterized protein n=1 Tax=Romanomermis culicivorax TaxID=13658 RepID=A0A915J6Z6_ROMCU
MGTSEVPVFYAFKTRFPVGFNLVVTSDRGQSYLKALGIDNTSAALENLMLAYSSGGPEGSNGGGGDDGAE